MSFWNSEKLIDENKNRQQQNQKELVSPFDEKCVEHGAYNLSLGPEAFITSGRKGIKQKIDSNKQQIIIPPGQFGLLLTKETVAIPDNAIGFISIRFSIKQRGLVNVSGFHVDPGFVGCLKFAVYNAGSQNIVLSYGQRIFMLWLSELTDPTPDLYNGEHANQSEITSEDVMRIQGEVASPAALKKRVDKLQNQLNLLWLLLIGLILALAGAYAKFVLDEMRSSVPTIAPVPISTPIVYASQQEVSEDLNAANSARILKASSVKRSALQIST